MGAFEYKSLVTQGFTKRKLFDKNNVKPAILFDIDDDPFTEIDLALGNSVVDGGGNSASSNYQNILFTKNKAYVNVDGVCYPLPYSANWSSMTVDGTKAIMVGYGSNKAVYSSGTSFQTWVASTLPASLNWTGVASRSVYSIAVASGSTTVAYSENTGASWTAYTLPSAANWIACAHDGTNPIAIATGSNAAAYSTNKGKNWIAATLPSSTTWIACWIEGANAVAIATNGVAAYSSNYGATWTSKTLPGSITTWKYLAGNGTNVIALANNTSSYAYSTDGGISWTAGSFGISKDWAWIKNYAVYQVVTSTGEVYQATNIAGPWALYTISYPGTQYALGFGNGMFVTAPYSGNVGKYSYDGVNWLNTGEFPGVSYISIAYGNGRWIALSKFGCAYSSDGITWTAGGNMNPSSLYYFTPKYITYGNGIFVVTGDMRGISSNTYVSTSTDGITWTNRTVSTAESRPLCKPIFADGYFFTTMTTLQSGYRSSDGITWTTVSSSFTIFEINQYNTTAAASGVGILRYAKPYGYLAEVPALELYDVKYDTIKRLALPIPTVYQTLVGTGTYGATYNISAPLLGSSYFMTYDPSLGIYLVLPEHLKEGYLSTNGLDWFKFINRITGAYCSIASGNGMFVLFTQNSDNARVLVSNKNAQSLVLER